MVPAGSYDTEQEGHARMRKVHVPACSVRRMRMLDAHARDLVSDLLDQVVADGAGGRAVDLHQALSLTAVFSQLFSRWPALRLANDRADLRLHSERRTGGFYQLPVTW